MTRRRSCIPFLTLALTAGLLSVSALSLLPSRALAQEPAPAPPQSPETPPTTPTSEPTAPTGDTPAKEIPAPENKEDSKELTEEITQAFKYENLHPAFVVTPERIEAAIKRGQKYARDKKVAGDIFEDYSYMLRRVNRQPGPTDESRIFCESLHDVSFVLKAFDATELYDPLDIPENIRRNGTYMPTVNFSMRLISDPRWSAPPEAANNPTSDNPEDRCFEQREVTVRRFVLTDDQGVVLKPWEMKQESNKVNIHRYSGRTPVIRTAEASSNSSTYASAYSSDGTSAHGSAYTKNKSTVIVTDYVPWSESHPYYSTSYTVSFLLFDKDGNALITPKTKKITLHIFTETGEQTVEYNLSPWLPKEEKKGKKK